MPGPVSAYVRVSSTDQNPEHHITATKVGLACGLDRLYTDHALGPGLAVMLGRVRDEGTRRRPFDGRLARSVVDPTSSSRG